MSTTSNNTQKKSAAPVKKKSWLPLFFTQALGVLNDNLLKGAICFIAVLWVPAEMRPTVLALASGLLVIPFLLVSPWAGRLSVRYDKSRVVNFAKLAEIPIMMIAIGGFFMESLWLSGFALLLMGFQSAIYAPSKYGLIRDVGGYEGINYGTGMMELLTFVSVLLGMVFAGFVADLGEIQQYVLGGLFLGLALLGWWASNNIKVNEVQAQPEFKGSIMPWKFAKRTWKLAGKTKGLKWTLVGLGIFWLIGSLLQLVLLLHLPEQYDLSATQTGLVISAVAVGIGLGCWTAGVLSKDRIELGMTPMGGIGMATCLTIIAFSELSLGGFIFFAVGAAFFSGWFKVPLNAWLQDRVKGRELGTMLALQNMLLCVFVLLSAIIFEASTWIMSSKAIIGVIAVIAWGVAVGTLMNIPAMFLRTLVFLLSKIIYRVKVHGGHHVPKTGGALVVANHVSYLDFMLLIAAVPRQLRFVMLKDVYEKKGIKWLMKRMNMIPINARKGGNNLAEFNALCQAEIAAGHVVCIFSEGTVTRTGQILEFKRGVEYIASGIDAPIIPVHLGDVIGTPFSFTVGSQKMILPRLKNLGQKVHLSVGKPMPAASRAFEIRQAITELEAESFGFSVDDGASLGEKLFTSLQERSSVLLSEEAAIKNHELLRKAIRFAGELENLLPRVQTVAVLLPRDAEGYAMQCALHFLGKTVVSLKPEYTPEQRQMVMQRSGAKVLVTTRNLKFTRFAPFAPQVLFVEEMEHKPSFVQRVMHSLDVHVFGFQRFKMKHEADQVAAYVFDHVQSDECRMIPLTQANVLTQLKAIRQVFGDLTGKGVITTLDHTSAFGLMLDFVFPLCSGLNLLTVKETDQIAGFRSKLEAEYLLCSLDELRQLLMAPELLNGIRFVHTEQGSLTKEEESRLTKLGVQRLVSAGMNETCSVFAVNTPDFSGKDIAGTRMAQSGSQAGTAGRPLPGVAVRIADPNDLDRALAPGQVGRVLLKGSAVIKQYGNSVMDRSRDFYHDWFVTPLQGYLDARGFLVLE